MNYLKTLTMVSMETKFVSGNSILDKLTEKLKLIRFLEGEQGFCQGAQCAPPPLQRSFWRHKKAWLG